jgi:hypothetical protein
MVIMIAIEPQTDLEVDNGGIKKGNGKSLGFLSRI